MGPTGEKIVILKKSAKDVITPGQRAQRSSTIVTFYITFPGKLFKWSYCNFQLSSY